MPKFQVEINGQNFALSVEGRTAKHGFFTWRFVEAIDPTTAENAAVQILRETQMFQDLVQNTSDDPPVLEVTQIAELKSFDGIENREPGLVWYEENLKHWWQFWKR
jgi:hypothetical protein